MFSEDDMKQLCWNFLQSFEEGNCAYDEQLSKQTPKHYYKMKTTKQFFNDLLTCNELKKYSKEIFHLLSMIQTPQYVREKELINKNRLLKKQIDNLHNQLKGHTRFTCSVCNSNIKEMADKLHEEYVKKNNLETYQAQIERLSDNLTKYNHSCRRLEQQIKEKDELIAELKSKINDLKTENIHQQLLEKKEKKKKKKKPSLTKKQQKQMLKLLQQMNDSSSEEESSSSDEEY